MLKTVLTVIYIIVCVALTVVVLMQQGKSTGLSGALGGGSSSNSYWGKNKGRSVEGLLSKITKILAVLFILLTVIINYIS